MSNLAARAEKINNAFIATANAVPTVKEASAALGLNGHVELSMLVDTVRIGEQAAKTIGNALGYRCGGPTKQSVVKLGLYLSFDMEPMESAILAVENASSTQPKEGTSMAKFKVFVISAATLAVAGFTSGKAASAAAVEGDFLVSKQEDLANVPADTLVKLYNKAAETGGGKPIGRFPSRDKALERTWPVIETLAVPGVVPAAAPASAENGAAKPAAAKKSATKAAAPAGAATNGDAAKAGRSSKNATKTIWRKTEGGKNPRRENSIGWHSWNKIDKDGMSVADYAKAGGRLKDLAWDVEKGHCELRDA